MNTGYKVIQNEKSKRQHHDAEVFTPDEGYQ